MMPGVSFLVMLCAIVGAVRAAGVSESPARRYAVVVGLESYAMLPGGMGVKNARTDASLVAEALESAGYEQVRMITDSSATRKNLESLLRSDLASRLQPGDMLLFYFAGLAVGGDFGQPRLLMYDTDPDTLEQSSWDLKDLGVLLRDDLPSVSVVAVTDASHPGEISGLAMMGPTPDDWPEMRSPSMMISSTGPLETAVPGVFAQAFARAVDGSADQSGDGVVSSGELFRYLLNSVPPATGDEQHPSVDAHYDPSLAVVSLQGETSTGLSRVETPRMDKVKFLVRGGTSGTVQCGGGEPVTCDPCCYLWSLEPGECEVSAVSGQDRLTATVLVEHRGRVICSVSGGGLDCRQSP